MSTPILSPLDALWQHAASQNYPASTLYVVATPIGNLSDITVRALHALNLCDAIACEDTRHSKPLLQQYGIQKPLIAVHDHNESEAAQDLITRLQQGQRIALISDAGTPAISDPGARVVAAVRSAGLAVVPLAGPSAAVTAMSAAGLQGGFCFVGFLPSKTQARLTELTRLGNLPTHLIFYEAPHRLHDCIAAMAMVFPERQLLIIKELSKLHENIQRVPLNEAAQWLKTAPAPKGEYVLIVSAAESVATATDAWRSTLETLLAELPLKQAVALTVKLTNAPKNDVYTAALALKNAD
ncbi:MAG: 16S rRNA (cytidine(1402)-2'-O)-methyltransferase [Formosimonas sp.]